MSASRHTSPRFVLLGSAAAILTFAAPTFAVDNLWTGTTSNDWNVPTNWSLGRVPTNANGQPAPDDMDDAVINTLNNFPVITANLAATPRDIVVGGGTGTTGRVDHRAGTAATGATNWMFVGRDGGTGTYNLANTAAAGGTLTNFGQGTGSLNVNGRLYVGGATGATPGSVGTFNMNTNGTLAISSDLAIGSGGGTGVMNVDGGTVTTGGWNFIGKNEGVGGGVGTLKISGGTFTNNGARTFIGLGDSTGSMEISGGVYNNTALGSDNFFAIGVNNLVNPVTPTLNMTGGTLNSAHAFSIGGIEPFNGNGDVNFVGTGKGAATINGVNARLNSFGEFWIGQGSGSTGELTLNAGTLAVDNWIDIGRFGATGKMTMTGGNLMKTGGGHFLVGDGGGANGTLILSGGTIAINTGELWVGQNGATGQFDMSGGTLNVGNWTAIGRVGGTGTMNLTGGTFTKTGGGVFIVADPVGDVRGATGILNQSGTGNLITNEIWVGQGVGGNGTYNISSGTLDSAGWIAVGREGGVGTVNLSGTGIIKKTGGSGNHIVIGSLSGTGLVNQTGGQFLTEGGGDILIGEVGGPGGGSGEWDITGGTGAATSLRIGWAGRPGIVKIGGTGAVTMTAIAGNDDTGRVFVGQSAGDGTLTVEGTGTLQADHINVGGSTGKGIVNQTGGTITANRWIAVGIGSSQEAEFNLSGGTTNASGFEVGADTAGLVRVSGNGALKAAFDLEVPTRNGAGVFEITGGTVDASRLLLGGRDGNTLGSGVVNQSNGFVKLTGDLVVQRPNVGTGRYNLTGGTLSVDGAIQLNLGTFTFAGGKLTRSNAGVIAFTGNLTTSAPGATFDLDNDKTFAISGAFDKTVGVALELNGITIPAYDGTGVDTGSFTIGTVGSIVGIFTPVTDTITGLMNLANAMFISEVQGEATSFPNQNVFWVQETAGTVTLQYRVVPEPGTAALGTLAGLMLASARRRRRK